MKNFLVITVFGLFLMACSSGGNQQTVETGEAQEVAEASAEATTLAVDTSQSLVTWIGSKPTGQHNGTINLESGNLMVSEGTIESGTFTMDISSLDIMDLKGDPDSYQKLHGHLMSDDFFDEANHPNATFEIVEIKEYDSTMLAQDKEQFKTDYTPATLSEFMVENPTHYITGNLTMRGTTKSISFPAQVMMEDGMIKAEAKFNIDRTEWGLSYNDEANVVDKAKDRFIYNTVNIGFNLVASN
jgi:polyisoprenoid-binding protein YceI